MKSKIVRKISTAVLLAVLVLASFGVLIKIPPANAVGCHLESVYIEIDSGVGGGFVQRYLDNSYNAVNITIDTSNATHQNDNCDIRFFTSDSEVEGFAWGTATNNSHSEYYDQELVVYNATDSLPLQEFNTSTFAPTFVWDGATLSWYGNDTNVLICSVDTSAFFSAPLDYIRSTMCFDSGSVTVNLRSESYNQRPISLFSENFETDLSQWTSSTIPSESHTEINTTEYYTGSQSGLVHGESNGTVYGVASLSNSTNFAAYDAVETWFSFDVRTAHIGYIGASPLSTVLFLDIQDNAISAAVENDSGTLTWDFAYTSSGGGNNVASTNVPVLLDTWYEMRIGIILNDTAGGFEFYINGTEEFNVTGLNTFNYPARPYTVGPIMLTAICDNFNAGFFNEFYYDNVEVGYIPKLADVYWFDFSFTDQNGASIPASEFTFAWAYDGNGTSFNYTLGDATLLAGIYDIWSFWKGINLIALYSHGAAQYIPTDTALYGNTTLSSPVNLPMLPWNNGYIFVNDTGLTATITINEQTSNILNVTISGASADYNTTISGFSSPPALVQLNGTLPTYDYNATEQMITIVSDGTNDSIFYIDILGPRAVVYQSIGDGIVTPSNGSWSPIGGSLYYSYLPVGNGVNLSETPNSGSVFVSWELNGVNASTSSTFYFDVPPNPPDGTNIIAYFEYSAPPAPDYYWFDFVFHDQNSVVIPTSEFTLGFYNSSQLLSYTLGAATLESGTYKITFAWRGVNYGYQNYDTATYGNVTTVVTFPMLTWKNGYIALTDWTATITINSQDDAHLNFTVSGAGGAFNVTVSGYPKEPAVVKYNGTATDYTYSSAQEAVTTNSTAPDGEFYLEPTSTNSGNGEGNTGNGGGSWASPIVDAAQSVIDAIKKIPPIGIFAIIAVLGLIAIGGMGNSKRKSGTPSRSFRKR